MAGDTEGNRSLRLNETSPGQAMRLAIKIREVPAPKFSKTDKDPTGCSQPEVGEVKISQTPGEGYAAHGDLLWRYLQC